MEVKRCKNCGNEVFHQFCAHCGQKTSVETLSIKRLIKELSDNIFQINHGLFFSIIELTMRPAKSVENYLIGRRKQYFQPIAYAFTLATLYFLLTKLIDHGTIIDEMVEGYLLGVEQKNTSTNQISKDIIAWLSNNYAYTMLMLVPFFALASRLAFINVKRNYLEHLVLNLYVTGHQSLIYGALAIVSLVVNYNDVAELIAVVLSVSYCTLTFTQFFKGSHIIIRLLQCFIMYLLCFVYLVFILGLVLLLTNNM